MRRHRFLLRRIAPIVVIGLALPLSATVSGAGSSSDDKMTADTLEVQAKFIKLWNENKIEECIKEVYTEDAISVPPNHEPLRGHAEIIAYFKTARQSLGKLKEGLEPHRVKSSGNMTSLVPQYETEQPTVRFTAHEVYQRQSDGTVKLTHDMFGFRDPLQ